METKTWNPAPPAADGGPATHPPTVDGHWGAPPPAWAPPGPTVPPEPAPLGSGPLWGSPTSGDAGSAPDPTWSTPGWGRPDPGAPPSVPPGAAPGAGSPDRRPRRGPKLAAAALVAALALGGAAGVGFAAGNEVGADDGSGPAPSDAMSAATTPAIPTADAVTEPVAAVAAALGPAVVQLETQTGLGSGFVYDADAGLIMTAAHVVDGASSVTVRLADGRSVEGTVVGADDGSDIAVVQVEADGLIAAQLASGDPAVGQLAVAIGSPFGLDQTVTSGIVSAVGRSVETPGGAVAMIQTDAPINPGNSGGALADREGRVIGVNDSIASESGGNVGVGFAVPIETAKAIADRLVAGEPITNGFLGVSAADATGSQTGAQVVQVSAGSPAADAGIETGDVVTSIDGSPVDSSADLVAAVRSRQPGDQVTLGVARQGDDSEVTVTLGEAPTN